MKQFSTRKFRLVAALVALASGGCDSGSSEVDTLPRVTVSGTVTLDGKPLPEGKLQFMPESSGSGLMTVGEINDGKFSIEQAKGPVPGKYRVMISSRPVYKVEPGENPGSGPPPKPAPEKVPRRYSGATPELEADVSAGSPNSFEFTLTSKR
jgi:hypothetical protein